MVQKQLQFLMNSNNFLKFKCSKIIPEVFQSLKEFKFHENLIVGWLQQ